jgi:energy-coupling factor transporter ATP-binding protein EcfA2
LKFEKLLPKLGDRVFFTGQTGSGKTTLAKYLLAKYPFVVIYDGKGQIKWNDYKLHTDLHRLAQDNSPRLLYKPNPNELQDPIAVDQFFHWIYLRGNTVLYVDEIYSIVVGSNLPFWYHACLTRGRELGISVWSGAQRPMLIPQTVLSESENAFIYRLSMPQDQIKVESIYSLDRNLIGELDKRYFYAVKENGSERLGPYTLNLKKRG